MLDVFGNQPHPDDPLQYWRRGRCAKCGQRYARAPRLRDYANERFAPRDDSQARIRIASAAQAMAGRHAYHARRGLRKALEGATTLEEVTVYCFTEDF